MITAKKIHKQRNTKFRKLLEIKLPRKKVTNTHTFNVFFFLRGELISHRQSIKEANIELILVGEKEEKY